MRGIKHKLWASCAKCAVMLAPPLVGYFPRAIWQSCPRWRKYTFYASLMTVSGLALLYTGVTYLGFNKYLTQMVFVPGIMAVVSYIVNRFVTFGDYKQLNEHDKVRYAAVRASGMGLSKAAFYLLVAVIGVQYLLASFLITLSLAAPSYLLNRNWAFAQTSVRQSERA